MTGTFTIKNLADGQLPNSIGDIYTVPASTTAIIKTVTLVNTNSSSEAVNLYLLPSGGTARRIIPKDCSLGIGYCLVMDDEICMDAGDKLQGDTTTASKVDFTISGVEES